MFKHIGDKPDKNQVRLWLNGNEISVPSGCTVAAAMLLQSQRHPRIHPVSKKPREPFCMMGSCFECLVEIDGVKDRQACMFEAVEGMNISTLKPELA